MLCKLHAGLDQCDEVDQQCRAFIWGDNENQRRVHTVAWENICKPKAWGGLGLKATTNVKSTLMMKMGIGILNMSVRDFVSQDGHWNLNLMFQFLPHELCHSICLNKA